ncbi:MAG: GNAT family N-acetyltransferase [Erysipelotrichaceae bacterium]|nr:GNAT family N-acetyltransferase [Erysipelotrichaceae bacterium]
MYLETERLILRPWSVDDAEECYRYASDPQVGPAAGWQPHRSAEESRLVIEKFLSGPGDCAIVLKETGKPIGSISLMKNSDLAHKEDELELGYWLGSPYWGQGLVPEAGREMLRYAFEDLHMARVWCGYYEGNEKSRRVQEKLGFRFQWRSDEVEVPQLREKRTGYVNCLTREQWKTDQISFPGVLTVMVYYTGKDGSAHRFAQEMEESGLAPAIRDRKGNLRYEYFQPLNDPDTVVLIDSWSSQKALDAHHQSELMPRIAELREKYDLHMRVERYVSTEENSADDKYIRR